MSFSFFVSVAVDLGPSVEAHCVLAVDTAGQVPHPLCKKLDFPLCRRLEPNGAILADLLSSADGNSG